MVEITFLDFDLEHSYHCYYNYIGELIILDVFETWSAWIKTQSSSSKYFLGIYDGYDDEGQELFRDCLQPQGSNAR